MVKKMMNKGFAGRVKMLRRKMGLSQVEVAKIIEVSISTYQRLERGMEPSPDTLKKLEKHFKIPISYLLTGEMSRYTIESMPAPQDISTIATAPPSQAQDMDMPVLLERTASILGGDTIYRQALMSNINAFYRATQVEDMVKGNEAKLAANEARIARAGSNHGH